MSVAQHETQERIESMIAHFMRMQKFQSDDLGRVTAKFRDVIRVIEELPSKPSVHDAVRLEDLILFVQDLHAEFDKYSCSNRFSSLSDFFSSDAAEEPAEPSSTVQMPNLGALPVVADRVKWGSPPSFRAEEFLDDPLLRAAFQDPEVLRKPKEDWPKSQPARMHTTRDEFLKLCTRWDVLGACSLIPLKDKPFEEAVGIFCVAKDSTYDRSMLTLLHLSEDEIWRDNRSDGPSRDREIAPPTKQFPRWLIDLSIGDTRTFDLAVEASKFSKNPARWLRLLLLLEGDIEPNPGPRARRGELDLKVGFVPETSQRMAKCFEAFQFWVENSAQLPWSIVTQSGELLGLCLRAYGLHCFSSGLPRYLLVYALTATQEYFPNSKPMLSIAWQIDKKWQIHEPGECRAVLPGVAVKAALSVAAFWRWFTWLGIVLLGFSAMLHPAEMMALTRRDLLFPSDLCHDAPCLFVKLNNPKTARLAMERRPGSYVAPEQLSCTLKLKTFLGLPGVAGGLVYALWSIISKKSLLLC
eukprot:symbB.v1.2.015030.t1/scaffold1037.1/size142759/2